MTRVAVALALTLATTGLAAAQEPLAVHVAGSPAKAATKEGEAQLKEKKDAARKVYADLQEAFKKQYGKNMEKWPEDKQDEIEKARDAFLEANIDWFYSAGLKQKDLDDSVREVSEALAKKTVHLADAPADADLQVQVVGRAKVETDELASAIAKNSAAELVLRVTPGGRMDAAKLAEEQRGLERQEEPLEPRGHDHRASVLGGGALLAAHRAQTGHGLGVVVQRRGRTGGRSHRAVRDGQRGQGGGGAHGGEVAARGVTRDDGVRHNTRP